MPPAFGLLLALSLSAATTGTAAAAPAADSNRQTFLQAEQFLDQNRDAEYLQLATGLKSYVLYPYLHSRWLKKHLDATAEIQGFIAEYPRSRYAQGLRQKWLQQLGRNGQWQLFLDAYRPTEDVELQCYAALARHYQGDPDAALARAAQLWPGGKTLPAACDPLFELYRASPAFTPELAWQRFHAALQQNNPALAENLLPLLPAGQQAAAGLWLKLHREPALAARPDDWKRSLPQAGNLFAHAVNRWLLNDPAAALAVWDAEKAGFDMPAATVLETEQHLAVELARERDPRAYQRLAALPEKTAASREWQVRAALYRQDWPRVAEALAALTDEEKQLDRWQYWLARAQAATLGEPQAEAQYRAVAGKRSYFGFLAAGHLKQAIDLADQPLPVGAEALAQLQGDEAFQVVAELLALGRKAEAGKQWWFATARLDKTGLLTAARLAQQWQLPAQAIFTVARANAWDDMALRFPVLYPEAVNAGADTSGVDPAVLYGLIRQESAFDELAESPVGARGLMQLMPATGRQMARETKQPWRGEDSLFDAALNIRYGSGYYRRLLRQYHGNHALSAAAYNAGPHRVRRWLPKDHTLPGDIWIENIPYKETRNYVSSVLQYALIYQQRLGRQTLQADLLDPVIPAAKN